MDIPKILEIETDNQNCIYLHREGFDWYAYELSAFYLTSVFLVEQIEIITDHINKVRLVRMPFKKDPKKFWKNCEIVECGEDVLRIENKIKCGGFGIWKSHYIN